MMCGAHSESGVAGFELQSAPRVVMRDIRKSFGAVEVLHGVSFDVKPGEVNALAGENGAGKSTLMRILSGVHGDFTGEMSVGGKARRFSHPIEAVRAGIATIHQELSLVPSMSVADNLLLGREVVREMNDLGMLVDISHVSDSTFFDVIETTEDPVIASHSGCRALNPHHRSLSDDQLRALGQNGGVIGIVFVLNYLTPEYSQAINELRAVGLDAFQQVPEIKDIDLRITVNHLNAARDWPLENLPTIDDVLDHIDHAVFVAGVDHVGLGADMYPRTPSPVGIRGVQDYPNITRGLKERGYSDEEVRKIMGKNFLRVWRQVTDGG